MKVSDERLAEFNGRMNDWIAKQGLIFQLTHGGTGLGGKPPIIGSIIRFTISILLLLLLSAIGYAGFLFWKATGDDLPKQLQKGIAGSLGVKEVTATGFARDLSSGSYKQIMAEGNNSTFYNHLDARNIQFAMEPANGLFGKWDAKSLSISELKVALKAGESDDEQAQKSWQSFFFESPSFAFSKLDVTKANITWGYSAPATWGAIADSSLVARRTDEGWSLKFRGGTFSQGIFRDFAIETLSVELTKSGSFQITEAKLTKSEGTLQWSGGMTTGGARPTFNFNGQFSNISLASFLPRGLLPLVSGTLSGDLSASGSTNDSSGISFQISAQPEGEEGIILTKEFPLLRMLSHLDRQHSYRKVPFNQGSFKLETKGQLLTFSEINLASQETQNAQTVAQLKGAFEARPTTREEVEEETFSLEEDSQNTSETIGVGAETAISIEDQAIFEASILRKHQSLQFDNPPKELFYFTKDLEGNELIKNRLDLTPRRKFRFPFVVEGNLELAVPATAFEGSTPLPGVSPHDSDNPDMRWIQIDLLDIVQASTKRLSDKWEQALEEAADD